jgi:hypothetical protein
MLSAMDRRSSLALTALGVVTAAPYVWSLAGLAYGMVLIHRLLSIGGMAAGIILIAWGLYGLVRSRPHA